MAHEENQLQKFCNFYKLITKGINVINSISVSLQNYRKYSKKHYFNIKVARKLKPMAV